MPATLRSRFPQIITRLAPQTQAAVRRGAEAVAERARERVPDAPPKGRGLVEAIHVEYTAASEGSGGYSVVAGDEEAFYGHMVEFGTSHSAAQPFLIPALEESKAEIESLVSASLRRL